MQETLSAERTGSVLRTDARQTGVDQIQLVSARAAECGWPIKPGLGDRGVGTTVRGETEIAVRVENGPGALGKLMVTAASCAAQILAYQPV
jgi:hypothetical protein